MSMNADANNASLTERTTSANTTGARTYQEKYLQNQPPTDRDISYKWLADRRVILRLRHTVKLLTSLIMQRLIEEGNLVYLPHIGYLIAIRTRREVAKGLVIPVVDIKRFYPKHNPTKINYTYMVRLKGKKNKARMNKLKSTYLKLEPYRLLPHDGSEAREWWRETLSTVTKVEQEACRNEQGTTRPKRLTIKKHLCAAFHVMLKCLNDKVYSLSCFGLRFLSKRAYQDEVITEKRRRALLKKLDLN